MWESPEILVPLAIECSKCVDPLRVRMNRSGRRLRWQTCREWTSYVRNAEVLTVVEAAADVEDDARRFLLGVRFLRVIQRAGRNRVARGDVVLVIIGGLHAEPAAAEFLDYTKQSTRRTNKELHNWPYRGWRKATEDSGG